MNEQKEKLMSRGFMIIILAWLAAILVNLAVFSFGMMLPDIMNDLNIGLTEAGNLSACSWIVKAIVTIPIAMAVSRVNPKHILFVLYLCIGGGMVLQGFAQNYFMMMMGRALVAGASAGAFVPLVPVKINWIPKSKLTQINGVEGFIGPVGQSIGTIAVTSMLAIFSGWRNTNIFLGVLGFIFAAVWFVFYKEKPGAEWKRSSTPALAPLKEVFHSKLAIMLFLAWPFASASRIAFYTFWPTFAVEQFGYTMEQCGLLLGIFPIASALGSLTSPYLLKFVKKDKTMIWTWGFVMALSYLGMLYASNFVLLMICSTIAGYASYAYVPICFTQLYKIPGLSKGGVTMAVGCALTMVGVGGAVGAMVAGALGNSLGLPTSLLICALSPLVFGAATMFLPENRK